MPHLPAQVVVQQIFMHNAVIARMCMYTAKTSMFSDILTVMNFIPFARRAHVFDFRAPMLLGDCRPVQSVCAHSVCGRVIYVYTSCILSVKTHTKGLRAHAQHGRIQLVEWWVASKIRISIAWGKSDVVT